MHLRMLCLFSILLLLLCAIRFHIEPAATATPHADAPIPRTSLRPDKTKPTDTTPATFYQTIIDNNIFRPIGWTKPVSRPQFKLIATITGIKNAPPNALILHKNTLHTLTIGETLGKETTLTDVKPKHVTLLQNKQKTTLRLTQYFIR